MQLHQVLRNDEQFVAGFTQALDEVEYLLFHSENPTVALKHWLERQFEIVDSLNETRSEATAAVDK